jgi:hypothetical protein
MANVVMSGLKEFTSPPTQGDHPIQFVCKEVERKAQEGEDVSVLESTGPIRYQKDQLAKTSSARSSAHSQS